MITIQVIAAILVIWFFYSVYQLKQHAFKYELSESKNTFVYSGLFFGGWATLISAIYLTIKYLP